MPTTEQHVDQAGRNQDLAQHLLSEPRTVPEWAVTLLFYAALHLLEAYFSHSGIAHPEPPRRQTHANRRRLMLERPELSDIIDTYELLQSDSENARYDCGRFTITEVLSLQQQYYLLVAVPLRALITGSSRKG